MESFSNTLTFSSEFSFVLLNKRSHFNPHGTENDLEDEQCPKLLQITERKFCTVTPNRSTGADEPGLTKQAASIISTIDYVKKNPSDLEAASNQ